MQLAGPRPGYAGLRLTQDLPSVVHIQACWPWQRVDCSWSRDSFRRACYPGCNAMGRLPHRQQPLAQKSGELPAVLSQAVGVACPAAGMLGPFSRAPGGNVFLAGMLTGFLPCGLGPDADLALAASASNFVGGLTTMAAFGLGTVPLMVLAGSGASLVSLAMRQRLLKIAAWCVVLTGLVSLGRGMAFWNVSGQNSPPSCPMPRRNECRSSSNPTSLTTRQSTRQGSSMERLTSLLGLLTACPPWPGR